MNEGHLARQRGVLSRKLRVVLQLITGEVAGTLPPHVGPLQGSFLATEDMVQGNPCKGHRTGDQGTKEGCLDGWQVGGEDTRAGDTSHFQISGNLPIQLLPT